MLNPSLLKNPAEQYRIHPFWFWNGEMEEEQIHSQIAEMAEKGVGGFFISARQGMTIPYLSDEWFAKVKYAVQTAERYRLHVWLYDEYPYPSGIAGGEVILEHPDAKHYTLEHRSRTVSDGEEVDWDLPWGKVITATAVPVDEGTGRRSWDRMVDISSSIGNFQSDPVFQKTGLTAYNDKRFFSYNTIKKLKWKAPSGAWEIHAFLEVEISDYKYYGTFVDFGHAEAMRTFIKLTHERYKQTVGDYFGTTIKGMFTDETGYLGKYPWSPHLPGLFQDKNGYDLKERLHALVDKDYNESAKTRYDMFQAANVLLRETYHKQCSDWCKENGLDYVAEVPAVRMTTQLYSHVVGSDSAHEKLGRSLDWIIGRYYESPRSNPKMTSALARQLGRERALCECFHSVGWSMTLQDAKWMIDRMAVMGINFYNFHSFFYTLDGLAKHDAPPSQFIQNPYWKYFCELGDYTGRISYIMSEGTAVRKIALLDPTTSLWTHLGNPIHATVKGFDYVGTDPQEKARMLQLKRDWLEIGKELLLHQKDYDHLDPELFAAAEVSDGLVTIGSAQYSVLVLPPMSNLEAVAWGKIRQFLRQGGTVIASGLLPYEAIEKDSPAITEVREVFGLNPAGTYAYWDDALTADGMSASSSSGASASQETWTKGKHNAYFIPFRTDGQETMAARLVRLLNEAAPEAVTLGTGEANRSFLMQHRTIGGSHIVFVTNQEGGEWELPLSLNADLLQRKDVLIREVNLETGEYEPVEWTKRDGRWIVPLRFTPYESHMLEISGGAAHSESTLNTPGTEAREAPWKIELDAAGPWKMTVAEPNAIRFDRFELSLQTNGGRVGGQMVEVKTFIDQCADIADDVKIPIAFRQIFGTPKQMKMAYPIKCAYTAEFFIETLPESCEMFMDRAAISGQFRIRLNGRILESSDFRQKFVYDHANAACPVGELLQLGKNTMEIEVVIEHDWDGVVDALYLQGDFSVRFDEERLPVMGKLGGQASLTGGPYPGLPYYAGTISFQRSFTVQDGRESRHRPFELSFSNWDPHFHDCAEVLVNGTPLGVRAWMPYVWKGGSSVWQTGENTVEIRVTNTLNGMLDGRYFDYATHELRSVTETV